MIKFKYILLTTLIVNYLIIGLFIVVLQGTSFTIEGTSTDIYYLEGDFRFLDRYSKEEVKEAEKHCGAEYLLLNYSTWGSGDKRVLCMLKGISITSSKDRILKEFK